MFSGREWLSAGLALAVTLCVFLILPLLEWFNQDVVKQYMLREVRTAAAPERPPPALPPSSVPDYVEPQAVPPPVLPAQALPRLALNAQAPVLRSVAELPSFLSQAGSWSDWVPASAGYWNLSDVDQHPVPLTQMKPMYPLRARNAGIEGFVVLEMMVDEQGRMGQVAVTEADPPGYFEQAALRSASTWRFSAAVKDGQPVAVRVIQKLTFRLDDGAF